MFSLICGSAWWSGFWWGFGAGLVLLAVAAVTALVLMESRRLY